jgi:hypothetical protein
MVPQDPRDNECFDLVKYWIRQCTKHDDCIVPAEVAMPKRVIEIPSDSSLPPRLHITNHQLGQYVILSHCWGSKVLATLTNSLVTQYQNAIKLELLPKSFNDAIEITRRLGFRYLWIDALCIIQDNAEDWAEEAAKMAAYYGLSSLMISADAAENGSKGILTTRNLSHSPMMGKENKYRLYCEVLRSDYNIKNSILATRGWTAQERMLAPRILHYTRRQMIWECATGIEYEASWDGVRIGEYILSAYRKLALQPFVTKALSQTTKAYCSDYADADQASQADSTDTSLRRLSIWESCVIEYSSRSLTVPTDKLHAIAGVARVLNVSGELGTYLAGLWSAYLARSLNWRQRSGSLSSPPVYTGPSWSWAGMNDKVDFPSFNEILEGTELLRTSTDETWNTLAKSFDLKLIEHQMVLQDERNAYGAVLEGSYIVVEGACLTHAGFTSFSRAKETWYVVVGLDKSGDEEDDSSRSNQQEGVDLAQAWRERGEMIRPQQRSHKPAPYEFCMFLQAYTRDHLVRRTDVLLLSWVDQEAKVAQRVGTANITAISDTDKQQFDHNFRSAGWERWILKLV